MTVFVTTLESDTEPCPDPSFRICPVWAMLPVTENVPPPTLWFRIRSPVPAVALDTVSVEVAKSFEIVVPEAFTVIVPVLIVNAAVAEE